jgi:hypothetical protein
MITVHCIEKLPRPVLVVPPLHQVLRLSAQSAVSASSGFIPCATSSVATSPGSRPYAPSNVSTTPTRALKCVGHIVGLLVLRHSMLRFLEGTRTLLMVVDEAAVPSND